MHTPSSPLHLGLGTTVKHPRAAEHSIDQRQEINELWGASAINQTLPAPSDSPADDQLYSAFLALLQSVCFRP